MVSYCKDTVKLSNQQVKQLLIGFYGEDISFNPFMTGADII